MKQVLVTNKVEWVLLQFTSCVRFEHSHMLKKWLTAVDLWVSAGQLDNYFRLSSTSFGCPKQTAIKILNTDNGLWRPGRYQILYYHSLASHLWCPCLCSIPYLQIDIGLRPLLSSSSVWFSHWILQIWSQSYLLKGLFSDLFFQKLKTKYDDLCWKAVIADLPN